MSLALRLRLRLSAERPAADRRRLTFAPLPGLAVERAVAIVAALRRPGSLAVTFSVIEQVDGAPLGSAR